jgi:hypothetical protein
MKITLVGAAGGEVTGSCYMVETKQARILVDCGLFQGGKPFARLRDAGSYSDRQNRSLSAMRTIPRFSSLQWKGFSSLPSASYNVLLKEGIES